MSKQKRPGEFLGRAGVYVTVTGFCRCPKCGDKWGELDLAPDGIPHAERCPKGCNAEQFACFRPGFQEECDRLSKRVEALEAFLKHALRKAKPTTSKTKKKHVKKPAKRQPRRRPAEE